MNYLKYCTIFTILGLVVGYFIGFMLNNGNNYYTKKKDRVPISSEFVIGFAIVGGVFGLVGGMYAASAINEEEKREEDARIAKAEFDEKNQRERAIKRERVRIENDRIKKINILLGFNAIKENVYKEGKYWIAESKWRNTLNDFNYYLKTYRSIEGKIVTTMNGELIKTHEFTSANKDTIPDAHEAVLRAICKNYRDCFEGDVDELFVTINKQ